MRLCTMAVTLMLAMTMTVLPNSPSWSWGAKQGWGQGPCEPGVLIPDETKEKGYYCFHGAERKKGFNRSQCLKDCRAGCAQKYPVAADLKRCSAGCSSGCAQ